MSEAPLLETRGLQKYFPTSRGVLHAVDDVNLVIQHGQTLGVVGESGCGKSTLGKTIVRLTEPTGGQILFHGQDITKLPPKGIKHLRRSIQMVFQDPYSSLDPRMSVRELIEDPMIVHGIPKAERVKKVKDLMDVVGLASRFATVYPHELDGGRRQRIGIARALSLNPEFIICDEPVSALDVSIQAQILNLLMDLQEERRLTYLFITHDLSVVRHISTEIMVMYLGVVVEKAPAEALFANPMHPYTRELLRSIPIPDLKPEHRLTGSIRGEVSDPIDPAPGCRFSPRCDFCTEACMGRNFPLHEIEPGHFVACAKYAASQSR